jgi:hypothetical protein
MAQMFQAVRPLPAELFPSIAFAENAERLWMSWPVTSFTVNPSRFTCATDTPRPTSSGGVRLQPDLFQ